VRALLILGDIAFESESYHEAATHYGQLASRAEALGQDDARRMLLRYIDALAKSGSTEVAKGAVPTLLALAGDDPEAVARAGRVLLDAGEPARAAELFGRLTGELGAGLSVAERTRALTDYGKALRLAGKLDESLVPLTEAADLSPDALEPIAELAALHAAHGRWDEVLAIKQRRLDLAQGDERAELLLEIGEVLATHVKDSTRAAKIFVTALEERPDDRKVLTRLMKLYSEEKDWSKLVEVVLKLGEGVDDPKQKSKYVMTAAGVAARQLGDPEGAIKYLDMVLELDPENEKALVDVIDLREQVGDWSGVVRLLDVVLERATRQNDNANVIATLDRLSGILHDKLGKTELAVSHLERAATLEPDNPNRTERLAKLYGADVGRFLGKAVEAQLNLVRKNPFAPEGYRQLRRIYTEAKQADPAWCVCQALFVMKLAQPDEERFFRRMRPDNAAEAQERVSDEEWASTLTHPSLDPVVTRIFQIIEPAVLNKNAPPLEMLGYQPAYALDLSMHPYPMSQMLFYAGGVLGMDCPLTFQNPNDPGGISFLHAVRPGIVLGQRALILDIPTKVGAFIAARHLAYYRPGFYIRHLVSTGTGLRAWLFAAIKLVHEGFPVAAELESTIAENVNVLRPYVVGPLRDQLTSAVTKLLHSGAIDLKKWVAGVDLSADRAGYLVCHDLEVACEMIKASDETIAAASHRERLKELTLFSIDPKYMHLRQRLRITIDS
jgi:tetratricopeptide (TPR) repeat protein